MTALDDLLRLLDELTQLLRDRAASLREMGECARQAQPERLPAVLDAEARLQERMSEVERGLQEQRMQMAAGLGLAPSEATLGRLADALPGHDAIALSNRRERLALAIRHLREEADAATRVVRFALGFNSKLLAAIVGADEPAETYSAEGAFRSGPPGTTIQHSV